MRRSEKGEKQNKVQKVLCVLGLCSFACLGGFAFVHRRVIAAAIKGTPMPESPHKFCHRKK